MKKIKNKKAAVILSVLLILFISAVVLIIYENSSVEVTHYKVESEKLPASFDGFKILQISDLHNTEFGEGNMRLLSKAEEAEPDIIVVTGDVMDSRYTDVEVAIEFMKGAAQIAPVYYIAGNHEGRIPEEYEDFLSGIQVDNIHVLSNETVEIENGGEYVSLIGLRDYIYESPELLPDLKELCHDALEYKILLSHKPDFFCEYAESGVDLAFCGHAHGGQFRIPFAGGVIAPGQGLFPEYTEGVHTDGNTSMIVSRGLGNSIFPFRVNNPPELVVATLYKKDK